MSVKISKREFNLWLSTFKPREIVGQTGLAHACPISQFLKYKGAVDSRVDNRHYMTSEIITTSCQQQIEGRSIKRRLPNWAVKFTQQIDRVPTPNGLVSARVARNVFDKVTV